MTRFVLQPRWQPWRAFAMALLAVASTQFAVASHQFEHDAGTLNEVCAACVQIQSLDGPASADTALPVIPHTHASAGQWTSPAPDRRVELPFRSRAPPHA
jgi:hypothetical protein